MATTYKTPGVYIEEITKFPPSVAQVETAIPAFIGYTKMAVIDGVDYHAESIVKPIKISSLPDYEFFFGAGPEPTTLEVNLNSDNTVKSTVVNGINLLYDSLRMFYANGGGDCYIVSVGDYNTDASNIDKQALLDGLKTLEKVDQPTLLVIPETVHLSVSEAGEVHAAMLGQCNKLQDRFAVMDIVNGDKEITPTTDPIQDFRDNVGMNYLKYGASYYPWIKTTLPFSITYDAIINGDYTKDGAPLADITTLLNPTLVGGINKITTDITAAGAISAPANTAITNRTELATYAEALFDYLKAFYALSPADNDASDPKNAALIHQRYVGPNSNFQSLVQTFYDYIHFSDNANSAASMPSWTGTILDTTAGNGFNAGEEFNGLTLAAPANSNDIYTATQTAVNAAPQFKSITGKLTSLINEYITELKGSKELKVESMAMLDPVYAAILSAIQKKGVVLPPSGAIVGIYAAVDSNRGVWKAPANVSLTAIKGPTVNVTHEEQESLNVDVDAGKSINVIRTFTGKGTMVWGARTLAGNDNEWRYIPVRRFFNMAEESIKKATEQFVFEPNDGNTWVRVRAMIENFLILQWRAGALAGAKPEHAFYVKVGLGQTMTSQDILNGKMNIEIGMAVVRPAEFIILKFSHKMQES
ncbi:hypothetical protein GCM10028791_02140 [Echinicola sediminis]